MDGGLDHGLDSRLNVGLDNGLEFDHHAGMCKLISNKVVMFRDALGLECPPFVGCRAIEEIATNIYHIQIFEEIT